MTKNDKKNRLRKVSIYFVIIIFLILTGLVVMFFAFSDTREEARDDGQTDQEEEPRNGIGIKKPGKSLGGTVFTDLFSGEGWKDEEASTVYHDRGTTKLSFPPWYEWSKNRELTGAVADLEIVELGAGGGVAILVARDGKLHFWDSDEVLYTADPGIDIYPQDTVLEYEKENDTWILTSFGDNRIRISSFRIKDGRIRGRQTFISTPIFLRGVRLSNKGVDISCVKRECLYRLDSNFYHFLSGNLRTFSRLSLPVTLPSRYDIRMGKTDEFWVMGVVSEAEEFKTDLYTLYPEDLPIFSRPDMEEADCRLEEELATEKIISIKKTASRILSREREEDRKTCQTIKPLFLSSYPGIPEFSFDSADQKLFASYLAYRGKAFAFDSLSQGLLTEPENRSFYLNQRITKDHNVHKIFYHGRGLWMSSEINPGRMEFKDKVETGEIRKSKKLLRIESGMQVDLTGSISDQIEYFELLRGGSSNELWGVGSGEQAVNEEGDPFYTDLEIYSIRDLGYNTRYGKVEWVSNQINRNTGGDVAEAEISDFMGSENSGGIIFYFSGDGGENWVRAQPGESIDLSEHPHKYLWDFRWKAELIAGDNEYLTPWLNKVQLRYTVR